MRGRTITFEIYPLSFFELVQIVSPGLNPDSSAGKATLVNLFEQFMHQGGFPELVRQPSELKDKILQEYFLNRFINKYSHSVVKAESSQKKTYVIDQGMGAALDYKLSQDRGRLLETTVALELLKQGKQIAYWKNGSECDFVVVDKGRVTEAIQVAADFSEAATREREVRGLVQAGQEFGLSKGVILTFDDAEKFESGGMQIITLPAWQYFLG